MFGISFYLLVIFFQTTSSQQIYEEIKDKPLYERKEIYKNLSVDVRAKLWIEHLNQYLDQSTLNISQHSFVLDLISELENGLLIELTNRTYLSKDQQEHLLATKSIAKSLFNRKQASELFAYLGKHPSQQKGLGNFSLKKCNCFDEEDFCWPTICKKCPPRKCLPRDNWCGWFWVEECNGLCGGCGR